MLSFHTYRVVLGDHNQNQQEGPEQFIMVDKMFIHPKWNDGCVSCGNDIALLKLEKSATLNDKVQLACLPEPDSVLAHNLPCYATGWGRLYTGGPRPDTLQQGLVPVVEYDVCRQSDWWGSSVKATMVCVGGDAVSTCHGDSGGPLNCQGRDGKWIVEGVSSFVSGNSCNTLKKPSVFTRVASFIPWITEVSMGRLDLIYCIIVDKHDCRSNFIISDIPCFSSFRQWPTTEKRLQLLSVKFLYTNYSLG
ncbi:proproteinase E-like [Alosa sapidissima]|uniref:proproteinase E-like n=1 Tax=Alosa sapidissima TaxID=34773 RepID=UPI001C097CCF|nr:proproteinase E-like [Alosa sapidissima]